MKIAVVGAGIFGATIAVKLAQQGFSVDLFEKNTDILMAASGSNQFRLHRGYHYPRSVETALSSKKAEESFLREYGYAVNRNAIHYYAIARNESKTSSDQFFNFCDVCDLEYEKIDTPIVNAEAIDSVVKVREYLINISKIKLIIKEKIDTTSVNLFLDTVFKQEQVDQYDYVVNATYASLNSILPNNSQKQYHFELCEKPLFRLPSQFKDISLVVLDGPFMCIDPYQDTDLHVMGNVVHALHVVNEGLSPIIPDAYKDVLDKGVVKNSPLTRAVEFLKSAEYFMLGIQDAEYAGSFFTVRTVLCGVDSTDERPTLVESVSEKVINVFSGKLGNCVEAAYEVLGIISSK